MIISFLKMHGLGNDFIIIDCRHQSVSQLSPARIQALADRRSGIGCDQLILIEPATDPQALAFMRILNADGSEVGACGNASRCIGWLLMQETNTTHVTLQTRAGLLQAWDKGPRQVAVDMGPVQLEWQQIPLSNAADTLAVDVGISGLPTGTAVNVGNPHIVFFVPDIQAITLDQCGPVIEHHSLFPERINVEIAQIADPDKILMRVWERGAGLTMACGSGACATLIAAARQGLTGRQAVVSQVGGDLTIEWLDNNHILMTGSVAVSFRGHFDDQDFPA